MINVEWVGLVGGADNIEGFDSKLNDGMENK